MRRFALALLAAVIFVVGCGVIPYTTGPDASGTRTASPSGQPQSANSTGVACAGTAAPAPRKDMAFVYMPNRQEAMLFGGSDASNRVLGDTWILKAGCWANPTPLQSPPPRDFMAATYDSTRGVVLLYGGRGGGQFYFDTWSWDGQAWTRLAQVGPPEMFGGPVAGFDPVKQHPILFGLVSGGLPETWMWVGSQWQRETPTHSPEARQTATMALDPSRGQLLLFGGVAPGHGALNDSWTWSGTDWQQLAPVTSPPPRFRAAMGSSFTEKVVVLWGGVGIGVELGDAWKWEGTNWSQIPSPGVRSDGAAIDTGSTIIFFGGDGPSAHYNDVQAFDGATWSRKS